MPKKITVAHSPDSDDAFMFWAMSHGKVSTGDYEVEHVLADIETLNQRALEGADEITAFSMHAYAYLADKYALMSCGASMGDGYGPIVIAREETADKDINDLEVAIPGERTTAFLALKLYYPEVKYKVMRFDEILERVAAGEVEAGLIIHEGQLTYEDHGLVKLLDLGEEWLEETGLPLPLGGNGVRRDIPVDEQRRLTEMVRKSISYALEHRELALRYAEQFGRGLEDARADTFVSMYVNDLTVDYGERGRRAVEELLGRASDRGLIPEVPPLEFI
ncbi:MAG: ABC transporter substrate-binding protein [Armatimonadetes bacterium]|nr:ABC transporter substrate-binding protein [Armatimonadota bacterium]